jgi:hypothetical protein
MRNSQIAKLIFGATNRKSFVELPDWIKKVKIFVIQKLSFIFVEIKSILKIREFLSFRKIEDMLNKIKLNIQKQVK